MRIVDYGLVTSYSAFAILLFDAVVDPPARVAQAIHALLSASSSGTRRTLGYVIRCLQTVLATHRLSRWLRAA